MARKFVGTASSISETLKSGFQNNLDCSPDEVMLELAKSEHPDDEEERAKYRERLWTAFRKKPIGFWRELPAPKFQSPALKPIVSVAWNRAIGVFMATGNTAKTGADIRNAILAGEPPSTKGGSPYMLTAATRFAIVLLMNEGILERRELPPEKIGGKPRKRYFLKDAFFNAFSKNEKDRTDEDRKILAKNQVPDVDDDDEMAEDEEENNGE